eukprot:12405877-Karenia_brevis.AAC.1
MFGGLQGVGAEDAWYATALDIEHSILYEVPVAGGVVDLFKCFDQIIRGLLYSILMIAGLPPQILSAYMHFQEHAHIHINVAGSLGKGHKHRC